MKKINIGLRILIICTIAIIVQSSSLIFSEVKVENENVNKVVNLSTMALKAEEFEENDNYISIDNFSGDLTGYTFDCPLCGGRLACLRDYDISDGKDYYDDATYKRVKIVASSSNLPCGSIVRFDLPSLSDEPVVAIVLDRGVLGNDLDLLSSTEEFARTYIGRKSINYDVLRKGWE